MKLDAGILRAARIIEATDGSGYTAHRDTLTGEWRVAGGFGGTYTIEEIDSVRAEMDAIRKLLASGDYERAVIEADEARAFAAKLRKAEITVADAHLAGESIADVLLANHPDWTRAECENIAAQLGA